MDVPCPILTVPELDTVNVGTCTPRVSVVDAVSDPDVPVIVTVYCPIEAELAAVKVSVLLPVVGFGENEAVTPMGKPEADRVTLLVNPYCGDTEIYHVVELPWPIPALPGPETENDGT